MSAINNNAQMVGYDGPGGFLLNGGTFISLSSDDSLGLFGINDQAQMVGSIGITPSHGFVAVPQY